MRKLRTFALLAVALAAPMGLSGCWPLSMGFATPIPMPPWVTERMLEKYCFKNDFRTPIMPPLREGFPPPLCEDPPDEARILRFLAVAGPQPAIDIRTKTPFGVGSERLAGGINLIAEMAGCTWPKRDRHYLANLNRLGLVRFSEEPVTDRRTSAAQIATVASNPVYRSPWLCSSVTYGMSTPRRRWASTWAFVKPISAWTIGAYARRSRHGPDWPNPLIRA